MDTEEANKANLNAQNSTLFCSNCGYKMQFKDNFCANCGRKNDAKNNQAKAKLDKIMAQDRQTTRQSFKIQLFWLVCFILLILVSWWLQN